MTDIWFSLDVNLIPESTKLIPAYVLNKFSNDGSRILIGGYPDGVIDPSDETINRWLADEPVENRPPIINSLMSTAIKYTKDQYFSETKNISSIWYQPEDTSENG